MSLHGLPLAVPRCSEVVRSSSKFSTADGRWLKSQLLDRTDHCAEAGTVFDASLPLDAQHWPTVFAVESSARIERVVPITLEIKSRTQLLAQSQYPQRMHVDGVGKRALVRFCILRGATENIFQPIRQPLQGEVRCEMPSRPP